MLRVIEELAGDWRRLDQRIDALSGEIEALARQDQACSRLMTVPGIGPIISSAMVAAIGTGEVFSKGRDFGAWLGLVPKQISTETARSSAKSPGAAIATCAFCSCSGMGRARQDKELGTLRSQILEEWAGEHRGWLRPSNSRFKSDYFGARSITSSNL